MCRFTKLLILAAVLPLGACAQVKPGGVAHMGGAIQIGGSAATPAISGLALHVTSSTVEAEWTTQSSSDTQLNCGTTLGSYTIAAVDNGVQTGTFQHQAIVAGLTASTQYFCQAMSTSPGGTGSGTATSMTLPIVGSAPATAVSFSTPTQYNAINVSNQGTADTFYAACFSLPSLDCYMSNDDTTGWTQGGLPTGINSPMSVMHVTSTSPLAAITINGITNYGTAGTSEPPDNLSQKNAGMFALAGDLYMTIGRQQNLASTPIVTTPAYPQVAGQIIKSADRGATWNNFQSVNTVNANGAVTNPANAHMFGTSPSTVGSATFVMYCADDGTLGYRDSCLAEDNANAYVYLWMNEGTWNGGGSGGGGNAFYVARVARAKLSHLNAADYQWFTGGDGNLDTNWSGTQASATAVISNTGTLGTLNMQYIPALNSYLVMTFYYPGGALTGASIVDSVWLTYTCPHAWGGGCTLINTTSWTGQGFYNPIILPWTIWSGLTPTIIFTSAFNGSPTVAGYLPWLSTMTISH